MDPTNMPSHLHTHIFLIPLICYESWSIADSYLTPGALCARPNFLIFFFPPHTVKVMHTAWAEVGRLTDKMIQAERCM